MRFLFRKGVTEVILYLHKNGRAGYYEMEKKKFVGGRQTFSKILRTLKKESIVVRKLIDSRPPRVEYSLSSKGREVAELLERLDKALQKK